MFEARHQKNWLVGAAVAEWTSSSGVRCCRSERILVEGLTRAGMVDRRDVDLDGCRVSFGPQEHNGSCFVEITMMNAHGEYVR